MIVMLTLQDFLEMLPLLPFTHPHSAPLNLATMMPAWANPTDLGPKTYIANGQVPSVDRLGSLALDETEREVAGRSATISITPHEP